MGWKNRESPDSFNIYERQLIDIYESSITNVPQQIFDHLTQEVIKEYKNQVYVYTRKLIKNIKSKKYFILAISGSHHELIGNMATEYGFDDYVGSKYERSGTNFSGASTIVSLNKASALQKMIDAHNLTLSGSYAIGDSASDISMLKMVNNPIAFCANFKTFPLNCIFLSI